MAKIKLNDTSKWAQSFNQLNSHVELNIISLVDIFTVLLFFLLMGFGVQLTVLELNLPTAKQTENIPPGAKVQLQVVLRKDSIDIQDANLGLLKKIERNSDNKYWSALSTYLQEVKVRFPKEDSITLLLEPSVEYSTLIKSMDMVRSVDIVQGLSVVPVELFPNISIGDAVALSGSKG